MSDYMADLGSLYGVNKTGSTGGANSPPLAKKDKGTLDLDDYLQLMVAMFQNQTIDNTADIGDMMNNMVQMSVVEAISSISSLIEESTALNYAASLVGKPVTVGIVNNGQLTEIEGYVAATGTYNGVQVVFLKDKNGNPIEGYVPISSIMAIGWLSDTVPDGEITEPEQPEQPEPPGGIEDPEAPGGDTDPDDPGVDGEVGETGGSGEVERPEADGFGGPMESGGTDEAEDVAGAGAVSGTDEADGDDAVGGDEETAGVGAVSGADGFGEPMGDDSD